MDEGQGNGERRRGEGEEEEGERRRSSLFPGVLVDNGGGWRATTTGAACVTHIPPHSHSFTPRQQGDPT